MDINVLVIDILRLNIICHLVLVNCNFKLQRVVHW